MNVHSRSYPHITTLAKPGAVRLPNTLHEHFMSDPRGAASFKQWREDRVWELLQRPGRWLERGPEAPFFIDYGSSTTLTVAACIELAIARKAEHPSLRTRVQLLDGTVIKEWAPTK